MNTLENNDLVQVIRCKDCGYYHPDKKYDGYGVCNRPCEDLVVRFSDDFCSRAARKEKFV